MLTIYNSLNMHKCIDYLNFTVPVVMRIPYEMITAQERAALERLGYK